MKAAILKGYDKNGCDLKIKDVPVPAMGAKDILVRVSTAGVNPVDNMIIRGEVKLIVPYRFPLILGNEFVGVIEDIGTDVKELQKGDRVYGRMPLDRIGAFAEYVSVPWDSVAKVPEYLSDEEAVTVPLTALTAQQALELMHPKEGESIFISGGTGSLGAMAIPIAKSMGLKVSTSGNGKNEERVKRLGAEVFINYKKDDYSKVLKNVDYVLDTVGEKELEKEFSILKEGGTLVSVRAMPNKEFAERMELGALKRFMFGFAGRKYDKMAARRNQRYHFVFVREDGEGLKRMSALMETTRMETSVDSVFGLDEVNEALRKVASGGSKGKTIIKM